MSLSQILGDAATLKLILSVITGLLLLFMVRISFLMRTHTRLRDSTAKMEQQVTAQQGEILAARQDSNAWRGEIQRIFDAFRAEFSKRLAESEQRFQDILKQRDTVSRFVLPAPAIAAEVEAPTEPPPAPAAAESPAAPAVMPPVPALR